MICTEETVYLFVCLYLKKYPVNRSFHYHILQILQLFVVLGGEIFQTHFMYKNYDLLRRLLSI